MKRPPPALQTDRRGRSRTVPDRCDANQMLCAPRGLPVTQLEKHINNGVLGKDIGGVDGSANSEDLVSMIWPNPGGIGGHL